MANLNGTYDPNAEAQQDFQAIPAGEYLAQIVASDMRPTKNNDGEYLELEYEVMDGEYKKRKLWARLNLRSNNQQAQDIANRQFAAVREATGVAHPRDSQELHYKPHIIRVDFIPAGTVQKNGYQTKFDGNEIKAWKKAGNVAPSSTAAQPASNQQSAHATATASTSAPPWVNKTAA